jgi:hypothetical protein
MSACVLALCFSYAQPITPLRIDPDNALGGQAAQLFDSVDYIPLETTKESLFGRIDKLVMTSKYFFILDHSTDAILVFTREGRFYSKMSLNRWISSPNREYLGIHDFTVNEAAERVLISHWQKQNSLYTLDFHGNLQKVITDKVWASFACVDSTHYLMESNGNISGGAGRVGGNCILTDRNIAVFERFLLKHIESGFDVRGGHSMTNTPGNNSVFYTRSYDYKAYQIDSNGIHAVYQFLFPLNYSLPKNFLDSSFAGKQKDYLFNSKAIYTLSDVYRLKDALLFCVHKMEAPAHLSLLYSLRSGNLYSPYNVTPDSSNGFLPISSGDQVNILAADERSFYTSVPAYELIAGYEAFKDKKTVYSPVMQAFFQKKDRRSNPVLVRLFARDNL